MKFRLLFTAYFPSVVPSAFSAVQPLRRSLGIFLIFIASFTSAFVEILPEHCAGAENPEKTVSKAEPPYALSASGLDAALGVLPETPSQKDFLRVVYFHRTPGCATCQKMARMVFEALKEDFRSEVSFRAVVLRYVDFEDPKYAPLVQALGVRSPSLFLINVRDGEEKQAWNLNQIWPLAGNEAAFRSYVTQQIRSQLK